MGKEMTKYITGNDHRRHHHLHHHNDGGIRRGSAQTSRHLVTWAEDSPAESSTRPLLLRHTWPSFTPHDRTYFLHVPGILLLESVDVESTWSWYRLPLVSVIQYQQESPPTSYWPGGGEDAALYDEHLNHSKHLEGVGTELVELLLASFLPQQTSFPHNMRIIELKWDRSTAFGSTTGSDIRGRCVSESDHCRLTCRYPNSDPLVFVTWPVSGLVFERHGSTVKRFELQLLNLL